MQSSNPVLNNKVFTDAQVVGGAPAMTVGGAINKTIILFAILVVTAIWTWSRLSNPAQVGMMGKLAMGGGIIGLLVGFAGIFKPTWTPVTAPTYAVCQGLALGFVSAIFEAKYPGIVIKAVGLTFAVMMSMLMGYKAGWLQASPGLRKGLMIGIMGLMLFYIVVWIAGLFGVQAPGFINGGGPMGIAFSLLIVGMASLSLVLDFDMIERGAAQSLAKYMEWYCAFGLMVTLVWLYLEILRLLSKLNSRD